MNLVNTVRSPTGTGSEDFCQKQIGAGMVRETLLLLGVDK